MGLVDKFELAIQESGTKGYRTVWGRFEDGNDVTLDNPDYWGMTSAKPTDIAYAMRKLNDLWMDPNLGESGRRNNDAVDMCIYLHVLGCTDVIGWFDSVLDKHACMTSDDWYALVGHVERVAGYLDSWGPDNDRGHALSFTIN